MIDSGRDRIACNLEYLIIDRKNDFFVIIDGISYRISQQTEVCLSQFSRIPHSLECSCKLSRDVLRTS
jgi:hypothetical protein